MPLSKVNLLISLLGACSAAVPAHAFVSAPTAPHCRVGRRSQLNNDAAGGGIEEIEFRIYPDGRVTEVVRGVKGANCQDVTEAINKQLGNVVDSQPTEEMFEEEQTVDLTLEQKEGGWEGSSSW
ncbi:hypothetical protein ACHAXR_006463 [Thalassiosira sp. AJA248-18]